MSVYLLVLCCLNSSLRSKHNSPLLDRYINTVHTYIDAYLNVLSVRKSVHQMFRRTLRRLFILTKVRDRKKMTCFLFSHNFIQAFVIHCLSMMAACLVIGIRRRRFNEMRPTSWNDHLTFFF